mmetsp:Transcript_61357/g.163129  ORF Transcript_61357/g.163129 Transcript_61357/m.163129 type:complete len:111 (-) Transcript_61357:384-716(-)
MRRLHDMDGKDRHEPTPGSKHSAELRSLPFLVSPPQTWKQPRITAAEAPRRSSDMGESAFQPDVRSNSSAELRVPPGPRPPHTSNREGIKADDASDMLRARALDVAHKPA